MRMLFSLAYWLLGAVPYVWAQQAGDCRSAIPICGATNTESELNGSGSIVDFVVLQSGCLELGSNSATAEVENHSGWYVFKAGATGQLGFDIQTLPLNPGEALTAELDFALYGPFEEGTEENFCEDIGDGTLQPIRCNYEVNDTGFTGIGVNPGDGRPGAPSVRGNRNTYDTYLEVTDGELYYLFVNNFNRNLLNSPESFVLSFTGGLVDADAETALDCPFRNRFLGLDINACEDDPGIVLSALNAPVEGTISNVRWSVDSDVDGTIDEVLAEGAGETEYVVTAPNSGRYFVTVQTDMGESTTDDIIITYFGEPVLQEIVVRDDLLVSDDPERYVVEIRMESNGDYEYALNGVEFQDDPVFMDVPPGMNSVIVNDRNGCGTTDSINFLVIGYPKFFTPNGDSFNDEWHVLGIDQLVTPTLYVFDRYGKLLKQLNRDGDGWDGTFNGRQMPSSDYWFKLEHRTGEGDFLVAKTVRNHFSLVR